MRLIAYLASALALVLAPGGALAQSPTGKQIIAPAGFLPATGIYCDDGTGHAALCNFGSGGTGGGASSSTTTSRINYLATASGTGYSTGDQLERVVTTTPSTGAVVFAYWINVTQGTLLSSAPAAGNIAIKPETITNTVFGATQSGPWNVGITGTVAVTGTFWQATQPISATSLPLPSGAATASGVAAILAALGSPAQAGGGVDIVVRSTATDRGQLVGTAAVQVAPTNASRRGWAIQVQAGTSVSCYVNGSGTATADYHSLQVGGGGYFQSPDGHVGTGALSVICSAASTPVYFREW